MNRKTKRLLGGLREARLDWATAREVMSMPIGHMFAAKLHVSCWCPPGCLRVEKERWNE